MATETKKQGYGKGGALNAEQHRCETQMSVLRFWVVTFLLR